MTQGFSIETVDSKKPIILLYGRSSPFLEFLTSQFENEFTLILVSDTAPTSSAIHHINTSSVYLLDKFVEKIDYALLFLEKVEDKRILTLLSEKFHHDGTKSLAFFEPAQYTVFSDLINQYKNHSSLLFLIQGDIFGKSVFTPSPLKKVLQEVISTNSVTLTGNDLDPIFPISESDSLLAIKYLLFGVRHKIKLGFLFYEHPETVVSAIHLLRRVEPDITVKYKDGTATQTRPALPEIQKYIESQTGVKGSFLPAEFLGFEKSAQELLENKNGITIPQEKPLKIIQKLQVKKHGDSVLFPLFLGLVLFIVIFISLMATTYFLAKASVQAFRQGDIPSAITTFSHTQSAYELMRPSIALISSSLPNGTIKINLTTLLNLGDLASEQSFTTLTPKLISSGLSKSKFDSVMADTLNSFFVLKRAESDLSINAKNCPFCIINSSEIRQFLPASVSKILTLLPIAPTLLGYNNSKHYLLLFQNNGELRPSGGFIGSIGELTLTNGKIEDLSIRDVYDLDGQLKTHVEPHYIIRRYLEPHLYLRDSNFSPNFEVSASSAAKLYQFESGKTVDGVISLDFDVLKQVIKAIGPIKLTQYNKTLTEDNTFSFLQETIEKKFFPGSTEKKDILNAVFTQITLALEQHPNLMIKIGKLIPALLDEKHIMVALPDISLQSLFTANGYSGNFFDPRVPTKDTMSDMFSLNEANIGVNKSNYTLSRAVNLDVTLSPSEISTHATITFQNNDTSKDYRSYIRIMTPASSTLDMITIDGVKQTVVPAVTDYRTYEAARFKAPTGLEVDSTLEGTMHSFGFITDVSAAKSQTIDIVYKQAQSIPSSLFTYSLWYVKQPGTEEYPVTATINYPDGYSPQGVTDATFGDNSVVFSQVLHSDQEFKASLLKK